MKVRNTSARRISSRWCVFLTGAWASLVLVALSSMPATALADDAPPDVVLLNDGGRVRGTIVEQDPTNGVRIQLADGKLKSIAAKDIRTVQYGTTSAPPQPTPPQPAPPAPVPPPVAAPTEVEVGSIHVQTDEPATVMIDGGELGEAPQTVAKAAAGRHHVRVLFHAGGSAEKDILVQGGQVSELQLTTSATQKLSRFRQGVHLALSGEPMFQVPNLNIVGFRAAGGINLGLSKAVDLRFMGLAGVGDPLAFKSSGFSNLVTVALHFGARASARFNFGSVYSMEAGVQGGALIVANALHTTPFGFIEPVISVASFRFGDKRQFELTELSGPQFDFYAGAGDAFIFGFDQSIGFSFLLL